MEDDKIIKNMEIDYRRLIHLENMTDWLLGIPNEFNRRKMVSDEQLVKLIDEKLSIMEANYD